MSFYGDIKRIPASPWVFDKIYANRLEMDNQAESDNIHIGRYVLVNYRINPTTRELTDKWESDNNVPNGLMLSAIYNNNQTIDIERWGDSFDLTVWQRIFSAGVIKYILVAELRAGIPHLDLNSKAPIQLIDGNETWTIPTLTPLKTTYSTKEQADVFATEGKYQYDFPRPLALFVDSSNNAILGGDSFISPNEYCPTTEDGTTAPFENNVTWTLGHNNEGVFEEGPIPDSDQLYDAKSLQMQLYGVGNAIRDIYNVLFGMPNPEDPSIGGERPGFPQEGTDLYDDLINIYKSKGLYGLLEMLNIIHTASQTNDSSGEIWNNESNYVYFITRWGDASENSDSFIQNIPQVITSAAESAKGHYHIDLTDENQNYLQS